MSMKAFYLIIVGITLLGGCGFLLGEKYLGNGYVWIDDRAHSLIAKRESGKLTRGYHCSPHCCGPCL